MSFSISKLLWESGRSWREREYSLGEHNRGTPYESRRVQMHNKFIITERGYTSFGAYNVSALGCVGNWESLIVVNTEQEHVERFVG